MLFRSDSDTINKEKAGKRPERKTMKKHGLLFSLFGQAASGKSPEEIEQMAMDAAAALDEEEGSGGTPAEEKKENAGTAKLAQKLGDLIKDKGAFICLYGDIGAGKTAFARQIAQHLNVREKVTSPSFVIINEYLSGDIPVYHFDLYRLEKEGVKTVVDELLEYSKPGIITLVEWAEFSDIELPYDRIEVKIEVTGETERTFKFKGIGAENISVIEGLKS